MFNITHMYLKRLRNLNRTIAFAHFMKSFFAWLKSDWTNWRISVIDFIPTPFFFFLLSLLFWFELASVSVTSGGEAGTDKILWTMTKADGWDTNEPLSARLSQSNTRDCLWRRASDMWLVQSKLSGELAGWLDRWMWMLLQGRPGLIFLCF